MADNVGLKPVWGLGQLRVLGHKGKLMKVALITALLAAGLVGCQSIPGNTGLSRHGDGSTPDQAVDLSNARTEFEGIRAEKAWIDLHFPGAEVASQALITRPKAMDLLTITLPSGGTREVYFDISSFFGKL